MEKSLRYLPRFLAWGVRTHSRSSNCVSPLCFVINQTCTLHDKNLNPQFLKGDTTTVAAIDNEEKKWLGKRLKLRIRKHFSDDTKITYGANEIYQGIADTIEIPEFFCYFQLPDTFQSWFLVIQLHVWMVLVRTANENNGRMMRSKLVTTMWNDVEARLGKLKEIPSSERKKGLKAMCAQFHAALVSYDEGLFDQDIVLAAAVWRTFFSYEYRDPRILEGMVLYIRKQMEYLDSLNTEELMFSGHVSWIPLKEIVSHLDNHKR